MKSHSVRIGTLTYQRANNYGAALQMLALQKVLESKGIDGKVIDYVSPYMSRPYSIAALRRKGLIRYILGLCYAFVRLPRIFAFSKFREDLSFTDPLGSKELARLNKEFDGFIVGSDQVWNDDINNGDPAYFLSFVEDSRKKLSYAASLGFSSLQGEKLQTYKVALSDFSALNVREESAKKLISELVPGAVNLTLDPTLLLTATEWSGLIERKRIIQGKYIFLYHITFSRELVEFAHREARRRGCRLVAVPFPLGKFVRHAPQLSAGPYEWLRLVRDSEMVVTDSFHGCAMSINFNKEFTVQATGASTRIVSLLDRYNLQVCYLSNRAKGNDETMIDWEAVNHKLSLDRRKSLEILDDLIGLANLAR